MASSPKVSVILTSFNHAKYLREAIDSTLNQTFDNFELIIWDDASIDESWEIIQSYSDSRIKAFRNEEQMRGIYGINKAILEIATGEYIAIHHSDDVWEPTKLKEQVNFLDTHLETSAAFTWVRAIDEKGSQLPIDWFNVQNQSQALWLRQLFVGENHLNHPSAVVRRRCYLDVGLYRFGLAQTGDAEMWSRLLIKYPIHVIQVMLTKHRLFSDHSNTSGPRPGARVRLTNEWNVLRRNLLAITDPSVLFEAFPTLVKYDTANEHECRFLIAMAALLECNDQPNGWQFGLQILQELIDDEITRNKLQHNYSFTYSDLIKLTAIYDPYAISRLTQMQTEIQGRDSELSAYRAQADEFVRKVSSLESHLSTYRTQAEEATQKIASLETQLSTVMAQREAELSSRKFLAKQLLTRLLGRHTRKKGCER